MVTTHYKIVHGFDAEDYVPIDGDELEKAIYAHMTGSTAAFRNGSISGARIIVIQPDFHRAMGWNPGYKLQAEDFAQLKDEGVNELHSRFSQLSRDRVQYLASSGRVDEIGTGVEIPQLKGVSPEVKKLAGTMRA